MMWNLIYGLTTVKDGEEDPFEGKRSKEDEDANKAEATKKDKEDNIVEEKTQKQDEVAIDEEKKINQSVQDTQFPHPSPPHVTSTPADAITMKDVPNNSC
jgi:hypothetical protein